MMQFNEFDSIKIGLASPEQIRSWSYGEVTKPETINYRTLKPEREGLFCEKIFGPTKDWECHCGRYKRLRYKGKICERCGVEVTRAKVRRERMGHIELAAPVSHIWYFKGIPSRLGLMLNMTPRQLEQVLYFAEYVVVEPGDTPTKACQVLSEKEYNDLREYYYDDEKFEAGMGAEYIQKLLAKIDLDEESRDIKNKLETANGQTRARLLKRLEVVESFRLSGNRPEWMIMDVVPVIPPDIRPMVQLDGGRFATSDLNDLYRRVINRNNRLKRLLELGAPDIIVRNEKRMLQEAVDALIDNGRRGRPVTGPNNRPLKSLSDMLKGKQGRFRQNLLGKRVDYSGRSVIVVGPELKMYQCGLPKEMAIELFKPFVMKRLVETGVAGNIKSARKMVDRMRPEVWDALEIVIKDHPVMLNRAPTLHRLGIQAFEPVLVEGRAIKLHPLVCTAFNADFDGDQMAVHVPLSAEAQAEARFLMLAAGNLLKPSDGKPVAVPTQDMILGSYYLTIDNHEKDSAEDTAKAKENTDKIYRDENEAMMAYDSKAIGLHDDIKIRRFMEIDGVTVSHLVKTTVGRVIFNRAVPQDLGFVDRTLHEGQSVTDPEYLDRLMGYEIDFKVGKKQLGKIVAECIKKHGTAMTSSVLDAIKSQGYHYSTIGALTVAVGDATIPEMKKTYIAEAEARVDQISDLHQQGLMSDDERYAHVIATWNETTDKVTKALVGNMDPYNPIQMMADSGARGSISQIRQLAGMRGLIANTSGKTIEVPIRANYREGLNILEYFTSAKGARKGLADTALRTADSGYLTRRLVDVSQEVIIRETDCGTIDGIEVYDIKDGNRIIEPLIERLQGRFLCEDFCDADGNVLVDRDHQMNDADAKLIDKVLRKNATDAEGNVDESKVRVRIRSVLTCAAEKGVCACCYGANLATTDRVTVGEAVGIIAAQSIGEPGTQLTMRTFHTGGVAGGEDITQGLPRVEELFEGRKPKMLAQISEITGVIRREQKNNKSLVIVTPLDGVTDAEKEMTYVITYGSRLRSCIEDGYVIQKGECITEGSMSPHDVLKVCGESAVQDYLIKEVQITYRTQGVDINDKHIEVIVRQMMRKVTVVDSGSTKLIKDAVVDKSELYAENKAVQARINAGEVDKNGEPLRLATVSPVLLGITKASLATESFLSAASFQETTRVLTDAAIKGKEDPLLGLKENVIIGKLIPAGTGMQCYNDVRVKDNRAPKNAFSVLDELLTADEDDEGQPEMLDEE